MYYVFAALDLLMQCNSALDPDIVTVVGFYACAYEIAATKIVVPSWWQRIFGSAKTQYVPVNLADRVGRVYQRFGGSMDTTIQWASIRITTKR